jgi:hypothetical protein
MSTVQLDETTQLALTHFAHRRKVLLLLRTIAVGVIFFVASMVVVAACDYLWLMSDSVRWLLSLAAYAVIGFAMWWFGIRHFGNDDPREVARRLESADPRLREDLLSAVELADPADANGSESFREWLQHRVGHSIEGLNIGNLLPVGLIQRWLVMSSMIAVVFLTLMLVPKMQFGRRIARAMLPVMPIERASLTKVNIIKPAPPSGYVAEGDAVGVSVEISGREVEEVVMQWRTADGVEGEAIMTPRVASDTSPSASEGTLLTSNLYAANLSVATTPVEYRIIAGDAITLWHKLSPLPRPRVELFQKRFVFPDYAQLEDRVEEAEHGDLKALVGTMATLTVRFDQPVEGAMLLFGNRGVTREMAAVEGSDREFTVNVPIKTPANYQVDGTSTDSGLNNHARHRRTTERTLGSILVEDTNCLAAGCVEIGGYCCR